MRMSIFRQNSEQKWVRSAPVTLGGSLWRKGDIGVIGVVGMFEALVLRKMYMVCCGDICVTMALKRAVCTALPARNSLLQLETFKLPSLVILKSSGESSEQINTARCILGCAFLFQRSVTCETRTLPLAYSLSGGILIIQKGDVDRE